MIARTRTILAASSVALLALSAGAALAQEAPPTDAAPRARQTAPDRPLRQGQRARDEAGPRGQRGPMSDRPGFDIEHLKQYLDANPDAKRELMQYLRQEMADAGPRQRGPQSDRPMFQQRRLGREGADQRQPAERPGWDTDAPNGDRQHLRQFMQNHPEARQRLLEFQEQHPEARGRMGEFFEEHPNAMRRLMQPQDGGLLQDRDNDAPDPRFDGPRGRQFLQAHPEARQRLRNFVEQHPEVRGNLREFLQDHPDALRRLMAGPEQDQLRPGQRQGQGRMQQQPQMRGQRQGPMQQAPWMQGQRRGRMQGPDQMRGQRQGRMQRQPQMQGQRQGRMQRQMGEPGVCPHCNQPIQPRQMQPRPQRSFRGQPDRPLPPMQPQPRRRAQ